MITSIVLTHDESSGDRVTNPPNWASWKTRKTLKNKGFQEN
ncbi:hypothetical protein [Coleofasciculus sp. E2-BRE-01]